MDLKISMVERGPIAIIGREGYGDAAKGGQWVPPLWRDMQLHMSEIAPLVKHDETGKPAGIWGAMSDAGRRFFPWESDGLYLAGLEVDLDAAAPSGWSKWVLPAFKYLTVECTPQTYGPALQQTLLHELPDCGLELAAAVQEFYPGDKMLLYVPVQKL